MLTEANLEQIIQTVTENAAALSESLSQCFDQPRTLTAGDSGVWDASPSTGDFAGAGLVAVFELGDVGAAVLIPEALPLPAWCQSPNESQRARMETLSMEWSMNLFPPDLEASRFATLAVSSLRDFVQECQPLDWAATLTINVAESDATPASSLLMIWPLAAPQFSVSTAATSETTSPTPVDSHAARGPVVATGPDPLHRLRGLPVNVSVRLAEKKITVSQLLSISSGSLITFPKSCEALLELYVNNARYCRGEAVKIGENFGLKINDVGATEERVSKILN